MIANQSKYWYMKGEITSKQVICCGRQLYGRGSGFFRRLLSVNRGSLLAEPITGADAETHVIRFARTYLRQLVRA